MTFRKRHRPRSSVWFENFSPRCRGTIRKREGEWRALPSFPFARVHKRTDTRLARLYRGAMRFINLSLAGYFVLVVGVVLGLWQTGVLTRVSPVWIGAGVLVVAGLGIMMSVASAKPTTSEKL